MAGRSMEPALRDGDWLLVLPLLRPPRPGELVVLRDPVSPGRILVKRVASLSAEGIKVRSDAAHAEHLVDRGPVRPEGVLGRPVFRYGPVGRIGPV